MISLKLYCANLINDKQKSTENKIQDNHRSHCYKNNLLPAFLHIHNFKTFISISKLSLLSVYNHKI